MITKLSHVTLFVQDQQKAYDFYVTTLGFTVHTDATMENGFRWLTSTSSKLRPSLSPRP
jgi:catechol 2,3-dioxygenase-like lactoylglutathione lyase family enzyme